MKPLRNSMPVNFAMKAARVIKNTWVGSRYTGQNYGRFAQAALAAQLGMMVCMVLQGGNAVTLSILSGAAAFNIAMTLHVNARDQRRAGISYSNPQN